MSEQALWTAVVVQALHDAFVMPCKVTHGEKPALKKSARDWLLKPSADFEAVCFMAGLDADAVRAKARAMAAASDRGERRKRAPKLPMSLPGARARLSKRRGDRRGVASARLRSNSEFTSPIMEKADGAR